MRFPLSPGHNFLSSSCKNSACKLPRCFLDLCVVCCFALAVSDDEEEIEEGGGRGRGTPFPEMSA